MGVVSGLVMSYEFGTNWSVFSAKAGPVVGPLMAYEVLTAFFLEAGFLGVMLFGIRKVGRELHFLATAMVALGTLISATWILSVNSWMQTPAGFAINARGQFVPAGSWLPIIFNPSFPFRLVHTVIASYLTTSLAVGAWRRSTFCGTGPIWGRGPCSPWPCGWRPSWPLSRSSPAMPMA